MSSVPTAGHDAADLAKNHKVVMDLMLTLKVWRDNHHDLKASCPIDQSLIEAYDLMQNTVVEHKAR